VYPPPGEVFTALQLTPLDRVRCVILGQDPYHQRGQAHGLAFSVARGVPPPPSLRNMLKEAADDVGTPFPPPHGSLARWAQQGVLLLNAVLTVEDSRANAHAQQGREELTTALLRAVAEGGGGGAQRRGVVFCLWGKPAQETARRAGIVDGARGHVVLAAPHPSPLSAHRGFFGAKPFSRANAALVRAGHAPIDWRLDGPLPPGATAGGSGGS
jgi:uracil-DNA glycosylase